jgi:phosphatidylglycerophosphatase A
VLGCLYRQNSKALIILIDSASNPRLPDWRFVRQHPAHFIAFGGGVGLLPAPGTCGTLLAVPLFDIFQPLLSAPAYFSLLVMLFMLGVWASTVTGRALGLSDHGGMVWDEVVAFLLVLFFVPLDFFWQVYAFAVFRFFDIVKPPPIRHYDRTMKHGFGVMWDDILAAGYTVLVVAICYRWWS